MCDMINSNPVETFKATSTKYTEKKTIEYLYFVMNPVLLKLWDQW